MIERRSGRAGSLRLNRTASERPSTSWAVTAATTKTAVTPTAVASCLSPNRRAQLDRPPKVPVDMVSRWTCVRIRRFPLLARQVFVQGKGLDVRGVICSRRYLKKKKKKYTN